MNVRVRLFAALREAAGCDELTLQFDQPPSAEQVRQSVADRLPSAAGVALASRLAVDDAYVADQFAVPPQAVCDLIPPVSGG